MKNFPCLVIITMMVLVSCKDRRQVVVQYGVDGITPLPEAVDLGLPSGLKWASFNIGASKPEEYGDYYAWGETTTKADYSMSRYLHASGPYNKLTKYCSEDKTEYWDMDVKTEGPDGNMILLPEDDVAHVKLGGKWRMPTIEDIKELFALKDNENYIWEKWASVTIDDGDEVYGIRITRKSTGVTLFLPAAGYCEGSSLGEEAGLWGAFWSSSLCGDYPDYAYDLRFNSDSSLGGLGLCRDGGLSIRPVCED